MPANDSTDVLMTFLQGDNGVPAECAAVWASDDKMHDGFKAGCYFEIDDFTFSGGLETDENDPDRRSTGGSGSGANALRTRDPQKGGGDQGKGKSSARGGKFSKYILEGVIKYTIDIQEISISRQMDKASPVLLQNCLKMTPFTKALIVKRKVVGGVSDSAVVNLRGFLRMEFDSPLITSVDWEDGEVVKERFKFVCRGLIISYCPQNADGTLGPAIPMDKWQPQRALASGGGSGGC